MIRVIARTATGISAVPSRRTRLEDTASGEASHTILKSGGAFRSACMRSRHLGALCSRLPALAMLGVVALVVATIPSILSRFRVPRENELHVSLIKFRTGTVRIHSGGAVALGLGTGHVGQSDRWSFPFLPYAGFWLGAPDASSGDLHGKTSQAPSE